MSADAEVVVEQVNAGLGFVLARVGRTLVLLLAARLTLVSGITRARKAVDAVLTRAVHARVRPTLVDLVRADAVVETVRAPSLERTDAIDARSAIATR